MNIAQFYAFLSVTTTKSQILKFGQVINLGYWSDISAIRRFYFKIISQPGYLISVDIIRLANTAGWRQIAYVAHSLLFEHKTNAKIIGMHQLGVFDLSFAKMLDFNWLG